MVEYRLLAAGEFDVEEHIKELAAWIEIPVDITEIEQGWMAIATDPDFEIHLRELPDSDYKSRYDLPLKYEITLSDNQELVMKVVDEWRHANPASFVLMADNRTVAMRRTRVIFFNMDEFIEFDEIFDSFIASDFLQYGG